MARDSQKNGKNGSNEQNDPSKYKTIFNLVSVAELEPIRIVRVKCRSGIL